MLARSTFTASLASPGAARRFVATTLADAGVEGDVVDVAELLTSEIVTNAVVHAACAPEVGIHRSDDAVRVEVTDDATSVPRLRRVPPDATAGRGLAIVDAMATRWGVERREGGGNIVWFELRSGGAR